MIKFLITYLLIGLAITALSALYLLPFDEVGIWKSANNSIEETGVGRIRFSVSELNRDLLKGFLILPITWPINVCVFIRVMYLTFKKK